MIEQTVDYHCPTCRRNLGNPESLPENCPRCGTALTGLQDILLEAINAYRHGCKSVRAGFYPDARESFKEACDLWNTEIFRRAFFFASLLEKQCHGQKKQQEVGLDDCP